MAILIKHKYLFIIIILFIAYNSFFINKAFHIDDPFTISIAKKVNFDIFKPCHEIFFFSNPPFLGYYYAPIMKIFGEKEFWLHIFYLPFSLSIIIAMYLLSLRFTRGSLLPVLFLMSSSAFIISSHSIMLDIPLLSFFLLAIVTFIYGIDRDNDPALLLSSLFTIVAIFIKYSGLMLIPILFIYALLNSKKKKSKFLLVPILIFFLWEMYCSLYFNGAMFSSVLLDRTKGYLFDRIPVRIFASLSFLSGTSVVILLLVPFLMRRRGGVFCFFLSAFVGLSPFIIKSIFNEYSFFQKSFLSILFICSSYVILMLFKSGLKALFEKAGKDTIFLTAWFFAVFIFNILFSFIAARFMLLLLPPLLLFIHGELFSCNFRAIKYRITVVVLVAFLFSTVLAIGDYQFSGLYRNFIQTLKKRFSPEERKNIFFYCQAPYFSWGYSYYIESLVQHAGAHYYKERAKLKQKYKIFVTPTQPVLPIIIQKNRYLFIDRSIDLDCDKILMDSVCYKGNIFLHHKRFKVGFYSHDWGLLPFYLSLRKAPLECFEIYRLDYSRSAHRGAYLIK